MCSRRSTPRVTSETQGTIDQVWRSGQDLDLIMECIHPAVACDARPVNQQSGARLGAEHIGHDHRVQPRRDAQRQRLAILDIQLQHLQRMHPIHNSMQKRARISTSGCHQHHAEPQTPPAVARAQERLLPRGRDVLQRLPRGEVDRERTRPRQPVLHPQALHRRAAHGRHLRAVQHADVRPQRGRRERARAPVAAHVREVPQRALLGAQPVRAWARLDLEQDVREELGRQAVGGGERRVRGEIWHVCWALSSRPQVDLAESESGSLSMYTCRAEALPVHSL
ncbi:unnamed protein product [Mycena citricolor]|uniref:Uncharacterized protein n=1 Tax=Mycena citricolor TaxID=2018698 RepID=A0AAD2HJY9_9AGAR|nr:unnamed protein product [Mycena citricolor]